MTAREQSDALPTKTLKQVIDELLALQAIHGPGIPVCVELCKDYDEYDSDKPVVTYAEGGRHVAIQGH